MFPTGSDLTPCSLHVPTEVTREDTLSYLYILPLPAAPLAVEPKVGCDAEGQP